MRQLKKTVLTFFILGLAAFFLWQHFHKPGPKRKTAPKKTIAASSVRPPVPLPPKPTIGTGPKIAIVIDDIGNTGKYVLDFETLGDRVTYAILPLVPYSKKFAALSRKTGAEVILHLPLESENGTIPGKGLITTAMPDEDVLRVLGQDLAAVPFLTGLNNHMGSKGTADSRLMNLILKDIKQRGFFFLDSKTTQESVAKEISKEIGIPYLERDIFLDNIDSPEPIRRELIKLSKIARARGYAIGIGHYRPNTIRILREEIPRLEKEGFRLVPLKELLRQK